MLKFIGFWIVAKTLLLGGLWFFAFSDTGAGVSVGEPTPTPQIKETDRKTSDPYTGDLKRFDRENRAEKLQIQKVMDTLKIAKGSKVGDIGAGGGWFTVIAAKRVGAKGTIYANDIRQEALDFIDKRAKKEGYLNVVTALGTANDPKLPNEKIEAVLILNTYHEVAKPVELLVNLRKSLSSDALVGIIDRDGDGDDHGIDRAVVKKEADRAGFKFVGEHDFVKESRMDYFLVFKPKALDE